MITRDLYARPFFCFALAAAIFVYTVISGCTLTQDARAKLAVQYATLKLIESDDDPAAKAARIRLVAHEALYLTDRDDRVTAALIESAVRRTINWGALSLADRMAADALSTAIREEVEARVGSGDLDPEAVISVQTVLSWVIEASYAIPHAAAR